MSTFITQTVKLCCATTSQLSGSYHVLLGATSSCVFFLVFSPQKTEGQEGDGSRWLAWSEEAKEINYTVVKEELRAYGSKSKEFLKKVGDVSFGS